MTTSKEGTENISQTEGHGPGTIIDATARRQPRVHEPEPDHQEGPAAIDFLSEIPLKLNVILAGATLQVGDVLALEKDSIVQLDKPSGDPVDIYVENQKLGRGEVIVLHEKLRIRILEITSPSPATRRSEETDEQEAG